MFYFLSLSKGAPFRANIYFISLPQQGEKVPVTEIVWLAFKLGITNYIFLLCGQIPEMNGLPAKHPGGIKRQADPYDFDDDLGSNGTLETYKRKDGLDKEEAKTPGSVRSSHDPHSPSQSKKTAGNLYTTEGLQPSLSDLDDMFDSDSPVDDVSFPSVLILWQTNQDLFWKIVGIFTIVGKLWRTIQFVYNGNDK